MIAIAGGLAAAVLWAVANVGSTRAGHHIGTPSTVGLSTSLGLVLTLPLVLASPAPALDASDLGALALAAVGGTIGLLFAYRAMRMGKIGITSAIISTEGAIAAVLSVLAGEQLRPLTAATLGVIVLGVAVLAFKGDQAEPSGRTRVLVPGGALRAVVYATLAAVLFGVGLFAVARVAASLPLAWAALPSRLGGFLFVLVPLALTGRLRLSRAAAPAVLAVALSDVIGIFSFAIGSTENTAVASVLAGQVAAVSTVAAFILFHERLTRPQGAGLVAIALGVAALALSRA